MNIGPDLILGSTRWYIPSLGRLFI